MALSFPRFPWLWLGGKEKEQAPNGSLIKSLGDWGLGLRGDAESLKFNSVKEVDGRVPSSSSNRKVKRKWKSREDRRRMVDKEYDMVLVPSDGVGLSGSESDYSDWSIGWTEPYAPDFQNDDATDNSFAVLVPCYRHDTEEVKEKENLKVGYSADGTKYMEQWLKVGYSADGTKYMEQWLSSLRNF